MSVSMALERPVSAIAWDLRTAWAGGLRVALTLDACDRPRLEGTVRRVAATGAHVTVAGLHVPVDRILAVHRPSRLGDSTARGGSWSGPIPRALDVAPGQESMAL